MKLSDRYHKWVEWCPKDEVYVGHCPDLITGIHGDDPVRLYRELCETLEEVLGVMKAQGRRLPRPKVRPMLEVA